MTTEDSERRGFSRTARRSHALRNLRALVDQQAEREDLWHKAEVVPEVVLQTALRELHAAVEEALLPDPPQGAVAVREVRDTAQTTRAIITTLRAANLKRAHDVAATARSPEDVEKAIDIPCCIHEIKLGAYCEGCDRYVGSGGGVPRVGQVWRTRGSPYAWHVVLSCPGEQVLVAALKSSTRAELKSWPCYDFPDEFWFTGETHAMGMLVQFASQQLEARALVSLAGPGLDPELGLQQTIDNLSASAHALGWAQAAAWLRTEEAREAITGRGLMALVDGLECVAQALEANVGGR